MHNSAKLRIVSGGICLIRGNLTFIFLVLWSIMIFTYFILWKNTKFLIFSNIGLSLLMLYLDYKQNKK